MLAARGIGDDVLPLNGSVAGTLGEPCAVPICCLHGAAVQAFGAKISVASNVSPVMGRGGHCGSGGGDKRGVFDAHWRQWGGRLVVGVARFVFIVGGGAIL